VERCVRCHDFCGLSALNWASDLAGMENRPRQVGAFYRPVYATARKTGQQMLLDRYFSLFVDNRWESSGPALQKNHRLPSPASAPSHPVP